LPFRIEKLLGSKKLNEMARAAKSLGPPAISPNGLSGSFETAGQEG
jgi:hypothetical protein